jgi:hypothetical protein
LPDRIDMILGWRSAGHSSTGTAGTPPTRPTSPPLLEAAVTDMQARALRFAGKQRDHAPTGEYPFVVVRGLELTESASCLRCGFAERGCW